MDTNSLQILKWKYDQLSKLSIAAASDYEHLKVRYDQNQKQHEEVKLLLSKREDQIENMQKILGPLYKEHSELELKLKLENQCKNEAELYASKLVKDYDNLKITFLNILSKFHLDPKDIFLDEENLLSNKSNDHNEYHSTMIANLKDEIINLNSVIGNQNDMLVSNETNISEMKNKEFEIQRKHDRLEKKYQLTILQLSNLKQMSTMVLEEHSNMQNNLVKERSLKQDAENYASRLHSQNVTLKRESAIILSNASSDLRLLEALAEIDKLSNENTQKSCEYESKVTTLEKTITELQNNSLIIQLEKKLELSANQIENLYLQIEGFQQLLVERDTQLANCSEKMNDKHHEAASSSSFSDIMRKIKQALKVNKISFADNDKQSLNNQYTVARTEMMQRIQTGNSMRCARKNGSIRLTAFKNESVNLNRGSKLMGDLKKMLNDNGHPVKQSKFCFTDDDSFDSGNHSMDSNHNLFLIKEEDDSKIDLNFRDSEMRNAEC